MVIISDIFCAVQGSRWSGGLQARGAGGGIMDILGSFIQCTGCGFLLLLLYYYYIIPISGGGGGEKQNILSS